MAMRKGMGSVGLCGSLICVVVRNEGGMGEGGDARWIGELVGEVSLIVSYWMASKKIGN